MPTDIWDISVPIHPAMLLWPGDPPVAITPALRVSAGDPANVSALALGSHTGTHIDPPSHFFDGAAGVDQIPLATLVGPATVVEIPRLAQATSGWIEPADLAGGDLDGVERVLFKTGNSRLWAAPGPPRFPDSFVGISPAAAGWLVEHGVGLVGVDFLSVEPPDAPGQPTHRALLGAGVVILEGVDLSAVAPGAYQLACLPLRLVGGDGGPARVVLLRG